MLSATQTASNFQPQHQGTKKQQSSAQREQHEQQLKDVSASSSVSRLRLERTRSLIELRKSKKSEQLLLKRVNTATSTCPVSIKLNESPQSPSGIVQLVQSVKNGHQNSTDQLILDIELLRRSLSRHATTEKIQKAIDSGVLEAVGMHLNANSHDVVIYNALWCLTNISSGSHEHCEAIVDAGLLINILQFLSSDKSNVTDQAIWTLSNLAGDCPAFRDLIVNFDGLIPALERHVTREKSNEKHIQNVPWFISNLLRYRQPLKSFDTAANLLKICKMILDLKFQSTYLDCMWTFCYASQNSDEYIQQLIDLEIHSFIFKLCQSSNVEFLKPAVRCLGNFAYSTDAHADVLIEHNIAKYLPQFLSASEPTVVKDSLWIMSNLAAGTKAQINHIFVHELILNKCIVQFDAVANNSKITFELIHLIHNLLNSHRCVEALQLFASNYVLAHLTKKLLSNDIETLLITIETFKTIFEIASHARTNLLEDLLLTFETLDGLNYIDNLQNHPNEKVYQAAFNLVEEYLSENSQPEMSSFGSAADISGVKFTF